MMENYDEFELNGQKYKVTYKNDKNIVWALTYVNGFQIKAHGDCIQTAYWAIQNHAYSTLNFKL